MSTPDSQGMASAVGLIRAIAEHQDRDAFAALFNAYAPKVKAFLLRRGATAAEELTQEVMLALWRKAPTFNPDRGPPDAWIFTVARNAWIDAARRDRGRPLLMHEFFADTPEPPRGDRELEAAEAAERVSAALGALSAEQREVVRLSFFDDRPHAEISAQLGLPLGTVKSRLRLAMSRLRRLLDDLA
jgi:RNA polymerase sigma-70 factor (ECF subfamily)